MQLSHFRNLTKLEIYGSYKKSRIKYKKIDKIDKMVNRQIAI